jgi:hypothetical protein
MYIYVYILGILLSLKLMFKKLIRNYIQYNLIKYFAHLFGDIINSIK